MMPTEQQVVRMKYLIDARAEVASWREALKTNEDKGRRFVEFETIRTMKAPDGTDCNTLSDEDNRAAPLPIDVVKAMFDLASSMIATELKELGLQEAA